MKITKQQLSAIVLFSILLVAIFYYFISATHNQNSLMNELMSAEIVFKGEIENVETIENNLFIITANIIDCFNGRIEDGQKIIIVSKQSNDDLEIIKDKTTPKIFALKQDNSNNFDLELIPQKLQNQASRLYYIKDLHKAIFPTSISNSRTLADFTNKYGSVIDHKSIN